MNKALLVPIMAVMILSSCKKDDDAQPTTPTPSADPVSLNLESLNLISFNENDGNGDPWDGSSDPDPYVEIYKAGALVYTSEKVPNAPYNGGPYPMNTASAGSGNLPIIFTDGLSLEIKLRDLDSPTASELMSSATVNDAFSFLYNGDHASDFADIQLSGTNGATYTLTGTFNY